MNRVTLQSAYVLHRRAYLENSFLVELFTPEYGRLTVIAKSVRKPRSATQGLIQPFIPLLVSWVGKGELMTLSHIEAKGAVKQLQGKCLFAGLYLNELLIGLLQKWDAYPHLFKTYAQTIVALQMEVLEQKILRSFEKYLLEELGYGLLPKTENALHNIFFPEKYYRFIPEQGWVISELGEATLAKSAIFSGKNLLAIAKEDWHTEVVLQDAKRLIRLMLSPLLEGRPIHSRRLFLNIIKENDT
jgi:DNA repair protein RecO (recombination protein O)